MTVLLVAIPALLALCIALINAVVWPRGRAIGPTQDLSVCIPARNEERTIETTVLAALASDVREVVVCDDGSTDATSAILHRLAQADPRLRVINAPPLPDDWVGKVHACHQLAQAARSDLLVFVDADTTLLPCGLSRVRDLLDDYAASVVTAVPRQRFGTWAERLVVPLMHLTYASWLPQALVWWSPWPQFLAANGQVLAIRRSTLDAIGGFAAISDQVVDDMALCRRVKQHGQRVVFADGHHIAECRMYNSFQEVWRGFSKNIFEGLGDSAVALMVVTALYTWAFLLPFAVAIASWWVPELRVAGAVSLGAVLALRVRLAARHRQPAISVALHPVGVVLLIAIAWNSMRWSRRGEIHWAGRVYRRLSARGTP